MFSDRNFLLYIYVYLKQKPQEKKKKLLLRKTHREFSYYQSYYSQRITPRWDPKEEEVPSPTSLEGVGKSILLSME